MRLDLGRIAFACPTLARQELPDERTEAGVLNPVLNPMRRVGEGREEASRDPVFALSTCLEPIEPIIDADFDRSIIADLEVQAREEPACAPVPAVEAVASEHVEGPGHVTPVPVVPRNLLEAG